MVLQILLHPYVYAQQRPILEYAAKNNIVIEAYSALTYVHRSSFAVVLIMIQLKHSPITTNPGGPLDAPLYSIANRLNAAADQVLLAWVKAKGAVVVT
jgi:diketogulonate reductase-like aldo/keto reductase